MTTAEAALIKAMNAVIRAALPSVLNNPAAAQLAVTLNQWDATMDANATNVGNAINTSKSFKALPVVAVANLPGSPATNDEAIVTDSTVATNAGVVAGGGVIRVLVKYNGTSWLIV